jgi:tRNA-Thr(GGU) m(6)t(6)A37 methyltransferase TsaA
MKPTPALSLRPVAVLRCAFTDCAGTPIQSVYAAEQTARVEVDPAFQEALLDLDGFEHCWLITHLHRATPGPLTIVPFRDDRPHGVFATRSPNRPNPLGLSRVRLLRIEGCTLHIAGVDMIDGTPILDIKPYIPAFDALATSRAGWFDKQHNQRVVADERFSAKAATWDESPRRRAIAAAALAAVRESLPLAADWHILDVGCGTGLLGLGLAEAVAAVHGIDTAEGMVTQFLAKAGGHRGISAECRDLIADPICEARFDAALSAMAFHHIPDTAAMLRSLATCLKPSGWLAIIDLAAEDGSFHPIDEPVPHHGFAAPAFTQLLENAGFADICLSEIHRIAKETRPEPYPIFLATARRI